MADYGLLATGYAPKPTTVVRDEINAAIWAFAGPSLDLSDASLLGFLIGIIAERLGVLDENCEAINSSQDPDKASGAALDALCALTGTFRTAPEPSTVTLTLCGSPTTSVPSGSRAAVANTGAEFSTNATAVLASLSAWASSTAYALAARVTNQGHVYQCTTAGTSGSNPGPSSTDRSADITDGTAHWRYVGDGTAAADVAAQCTVNGPTIAVSGDIAEIKTAVGGWDSVINLLDATLGANLGTDEETRLRRGIDLVQPGTATASAIREALLDVTGVTNVRVFVNDTGVTDGDGVPGHHVECLVQGGSDQAIFDALFKNVAAGIGTHGTETGTSVDSQGTSHPVAFSRPTEVPIYVVIDAIVDPATFPSDGVAQIKAAIVAFGNAQLPGKNAVASSTAARAFRIGPSVLDASAKISTSPSPTVSTTIAIAARQLATWDTSRITVNTTEGTP